MSEEDDTYSSMFAALKHPIRRKILRIVNQKPSTYTEILNQLSVDNGLLNYHLDNMKDLTTKDEEGRYHLSEFGKAAVGLTEKVEETPRKNLLIGVGSKTIGGVFLILIITLASVSSLFFLQQHDYQGQVSTYQAQLTSLSQQTNRLESQLASAREAWDMVNLTRSYGVGFERAHISLVASYSSLYSQIPQNGTYVNGYIHVNEFAQIFSPRANLTMRVTSSLSSNRNITIYIFYKGLDDDSSNQTHLPLYTLEVHPGNYNEFNVVLVEKGWYNISSFTYVSYPESDYYIHVEMLLSDGISFLPFVIRSWEFY